MSKHRNRPRQTVHNWTINGGQGGAGGSGQAAGGAGGTGTGPIMNHEIRTKSFVGRVTNYTTVAAPSLPSDFRIVPLGDIDLQHEICVDKDKGVVNYEPKRARVRRVYSARVEGRNSSVAVVMYQGDGAEETWHHDLAKYRAVRHPYIVQVYRTASAGNIHATIFHDDLIPLEFFFDRCKDSHVATVYLHTYGYTGFEVVRKYFQSTLQYNLAKNECTYFIRRSTGQFCADLISNHDSYRPFWDLGSTNILPQRGLEPLDTPNIETSAINFLTLDQYHEGCDWCFSQGRFSLVSSSKLVTLGTVYYSSLGNDPVEIASMPEAKLDRDKYFARESFSFGSGEVMENGWIRFTSEFAIGSNFDWGHGRRGLPGEWLSQGNHIFNCFGVASNFEDYVVVNWIEFQLTVPRPIVDPPKGFLFLCPLGDFRIGDTLSFKWPDCPAYWSFDPSGTECISPEEATNLGFPSMRLSTTIWGTSWDSEVYLGLCQFHQGKGFDPDSQEVARQLGYPLYELSPEFQGLFAHMDEDSCNDHDATGEEHVSLIQGSRTSSLPNYMAVLAPVRTAARTNVPATQSGISTAPLIPVPALEPWMTEFNSVTPAANPAFNLSPDFDFNFLIGTPSNEDWNANTIFPALDVPGVFDPTFFGLDMDSFKTLTPHVDNFMDDFTGAFPKLSHTVPSSDFNCAGQFDAWPRPLLRPHPPDSFRAMGFTQFSEPGPKNSRGIAAPSTRERHAEDEISDQPQKKGKGRAWN